MTTTCWTQRTQLSLAFGPPDASRLLNWMPAAIAVAVFIVDFFTPRGLAAFVEISELQSDGIQIVVTDNGRGISDADWSKPTSLGLIGLEERLLALGGSLRIATPPSGGTRLTAVISRPTKST